MWFEELTGFYEEYPEQVRENISVDGEILKSHINGKEYVCGLLDLTPEFAKILKLLLLPKFNHSFTIGDITEGQIEALKKDLTKSIKDYGFAVQAPLIIELAKLYIELCKNT